MKEGEVERTPQTSKSFLTILEGVGTYNGSNAAGSFSTYGNQALILIDDFLHANWIKYCFYIVHKDQVGSGKTVHRRRQCELAKLQTQRLEDGRNNAKVSQNLCGGGRQMLRNL
ncbi:hypothetical protein GJ496_001859 [Pomphorhynchus laevis]|nr:hypothetical protein GJ496_001859 [Pomphorhynchus laevis]